MNKSKDFVDAGHICEQCGKELCFDGTGCFCNNRDCIVFNKYVLIKD